MSNRRLIDVNGIMIGRDYWDTPIRVDLRAYLRFSRRLDSQLRRLAVRWAHAASPISRGVPDSLKETETTAPPTL